MRSYYQTSPNQVVVRGLGQHVQVTSRSGEVKEFMVEDAIELARLCAAHESEVKRSGVLVRLRHYWGDNQHGNGRAVVHVMVEKRSTNGVPTFAWPQTTKNQQTLDVEVRVSEEDLGSDRFEGNAETFYQNLQ
jgi:hypothetical protein